MKRTRSGANFSAEGDATVVRRASLRQPADSATASVSGAHEPPLQLIRSLRELVERLGTEQGLQALAPHMDELLPLGYLLLDLLAKIEDPSLRGVHSMAAAPPGTFLDQMKPTVASICLCCPYFHYLQNCISMC